MTQPAKKTASAPSLAPTVEQYMSHHPHTIGREQTLATAHAMMRTHGIRHLPVLHAGRLVGIVSERDLHLVETLREVDPGQVLVEEAMTPDPLELAPTMPLMDAAIAMVRDKIGSVVVTENGAVVGVLTTVDALRALIALIGRTSPAP